MSGRSQNTDPLSKKSKYECLEFLKVLGELVIVPPSNCFSLTSVFWRAIHLPTWHISVTLFFYSCPKWILRSNLAIPRTLNLKWGGLTANTLDIKSVAGGLQRCGGVAGEADHLVCSHGGQEVGSICTEPLEQDRGERRGAPSEVHGSVRRGAQECHRAAAVLRPAVVLGDPRLREAFCTQREHAVYRNVLDWDFAPEPPHPSKNTTKLSRMQQFFVTHVTMRSFVNGHVYVSFHWEQFPQRDNKFLTNFSFYPTGI
jgi:hypothetical protein